MLPRSIKHIGNDAFIGCTNLETVLFNSDCALKIIPKYCFAFSGLKNVNLPRFVEIIEQSSFYFCEHLKNIDLYNTNISFVGESAFSGTAIENIYFPPTIQFISDHSFEETKKLKYVDFSSCNKVENYYPKYSKSAHDFILKDKKNKKKNEKIENSTSSSETPQAFATPIIDPRPLIIKPNPGNATSRKSYNKQSIVQSSIKPTETIRKSFSRVSPRIFKLKTIDEPIKLRPKLNVTCIVCDNAFCRSNVSVFKFDLNEYQWFYFFDKCNQIKEYSINSNICFQLKKLPKERLNYFSHKYYIKYTHDKYSYYDKIEIIGYQNKHHLLGSCYRVRQIFWPGQNLIPWKFYGQKPKSIPKQLNPFHFMNTSNLISINFSDDIQIENIPNCCFSFTLLEEIRIPKSVKKICRSAFQYCYGLRKVTFSPDIQLKEIENYAFFDCKNLKSISLPNTISTIPEYCFSSSGINKIKLPESIETIYSGAFYHCDDLNLIVFNEGLKKIGCSSFSNCKSLIKIELPNSLTTILPHAFSGCFNLRDVNIKSESKLAFIKNGAFDFTSIEQLKLNAKIEEICNLENMQKLKQITFHEGELSHFEVNKDGFVYQLFPIDKDDESDFINKLENICYLNEFIGSLHTEYVENFLNLYRKQKQVKRIIFIPKKITCLKYNDDVNIFGNDKSIKYSNDYLVQLNQITQIKFSSKFVIFSDSVFHNFNSITSIEFGENVNLFEITTGLFLKCKNLQKVVIPNSCVQIGAAAFLDCVNLKAVLFGKVDKSFEKN